MSLRSRLCASPQIDSFVTVPNLSSFGQIWRHGDLEVVGILGGEVRQVVRPKAGMAEQMSSIRAAGEEV